MIATFGTSLLIVLTAIVLLLAFVVANLLARVIRLEQQLVDGAKGIFASLVGKSLPAEVRLEGVPLTRVVFVSEDCPSCRALAMEYQDEKPDEPTVLVWPGDGVGPRGDSATFRVLRGAKELHDSLGIRVTPIETWIDEDGRISVARPFRGQMRQDRQGERRAS